MSSFERDLENLVHLWLLRGDTPESIIDALVYEVAKIGPAEQSVPAIVMASMERASAKYGAEEEVA